MESPEVRVGDDDRARVVDVLRAACADGRITLDEFSDRAGLAYAARTAGDLEVLTADLPAPVPPETRRHATRHVTAIMSGAQRRGRWRVGSSVSAFAFWGGVKLDLREAELDAPMVTIHASAIMGGIEIIVPEGIDVEMTGLAIMAGKECRVKDVPRRPGSPTVHVHVFAFWGGVIVRSAPPRKERRRVLLERVQGESEPTALEEAVLADPSPPTFVVAAPAESTVTLLITDIEGFTNLTERLGDHEAQAVLREHNGIVRQRANQHGGHEVKSIGDSFMLAFTSVARALRCATDIQRDLLERMNGDTAEPVRVRMGVHTGEALHEDDDLFGRTVIIASRIATEASGGEILASSLVVDLASSDPAFAFDEGREVMLKGLSRIQRLHALKWDVPEPASS